MNREIEKAEIESLKSLDMEFLFNEQFDLSAVYERAIEESEKKIGMFGDAIRKEIGSADYEEFDLKLDIDDEVKEGILEGKIKLIEDADGKMFAQYAGEKGCFGKKIAVKKELKESGLTAEGLKFALQMEEIKAEFKEMVDTLKVLDTRVSDILGGQFNDRLGLYYSAVNMILESKQVDNPGLKKQMVAHALQSLNEAQAKIIQQFRSDLSYLVKEEYKKQKKGTVLIDEHMQSIRECYQAINRIAQVKAAVFAEQGELNAMLTAFYEHGKYIDSFITPFAGMLTELDKTEHFIAKGSWGKAAGTLIGCEKIKKQIAGNKTYYLSEAKSNG